METSPQPELSHPAWAGNTPEEGSVWMCTVTVGSPQTEFFMPNGAAPTLPDPGQMAQRALETMKLETPQISLAPAPPLKTYVGLETWLWMGENQYRDLTLTVTAGNTSVTVVAAPTKAAWAMGDGQYVNCASGGRAWVNGMNDRQTTDCSYRYSKTSHKQAGDTFPVTARIDYEVDWSCTGACTSASGTLGEIPGPTSNAELRVGERQSVVVQDN